MADTLQQLLNEQADRDTVAVRYGDRTWTYRQYVAEAKNQAAALIGAADQNRPLHVGVLLGNTPDMLIALAAAALGGYVVCGINTTRRGDALAAAKVAPGKAAGARRRPDAAEQRDEVEPGRRQHRLEPAQIRDVGYVAGDCGLSVLDQDPLSS